MQDPNNPQNFDPQQPPQAPSPSPTPEQPFQPQPASQPEAQPAPQQYTAQPEGTQTPPATDTPEVQPTPQAPEAPAQNGFFAQQPPEAVPSTTPAPTPEPIIGSPKKSKKPLIILLIIAAVVIIGGGIAFALSQGGVPDGLSASQAGTSDTKEIDADKKAGIAATNIADLKAVCENKKITNAPAATKPYKLLPFFKGTDDWGIYALNDSRLNSQLSEINTVACVSADTSTEKLVKSACEVMNFATMQKVTVDVYSITYKVTFYEASTGKIISSTTVTPASQDCPQAVNAEGKYYVIPTEGDLRPALDAFFA